MYKTLISAETLHDNLQNPDWVIVDCRYDLADTVQGRQNYHAGHIPGAVYAHLDDDLSGPPVTDNGRHPLPSPAALTRLFGRLGIDRRVQVVVYDDKNGALAARLWWMLRYMRHEAVAVLDGGWSAWTAAGYLTFAGAESNGQRVFLGAPRSERLVQMADVSAQKLLVDSRDAARYRGEVEPIDRVAGHIPGAVNFHFAQVWGEDGRYLPAAEMRAKLTTLLEEVSPAETTFYCGSGVTACVNLLALAHAGLGDGRLYVGSWSEWSRDESRPVAGGED
jgi:thiosulfate/3-mercaptopyruvate sulfurtransferase